MIEKYPVKNLDNPARIIEGEAVIVTPDDSQLHTLNDVGTFIWDRADGATTLAAIIKELCHTFDVEPDHAERDAVEFVGQCIEKKVMFLKDGPSAADVRSD